MKSFFKGLFDTTKDYLGILLMPVILVLFFGPLEIYISNIDWFWFGVKDLFIYLVVFTLVGAGFVLMLWAILGKAIGKPMMYIGELIFGLAMSTYIQGTYLRTEYGALNGDSIDWSQYRTDGIISIVVYTIVLVVCIVCVIRYKIKAIKVSNYLSYAVIGIMAFTIVTLGIQNNVFQRKITVSPTKYNEFSYSKDENMIIFIMDTFDSRTFERVLNDHPEYKDKLDGFTFYNNATSVYNVTDYSVPQILTCKEYYNETLYGDYVTEAYNSENGLIRQLSDKGWEVDAYLDKMFIDDDTALNHFNNYVKSETGVSSHKRIVLDMYKFVGFRYMPEQLKKYFWFYPDDMQVNKTIKNLATGENMESDYMYTWDNVKFYNDMTNAKFDDNSSKPTLHVYYMRGMHYPLCHGSKFEVEDGIDYSFMVYEVAESMFLLMDEMISRLKEAGVYDNTTIIFMGDHGGWLVDEYEYKSSPMFIVKGKNEHHSIQTSGAYFKYDELRKVYDNLLAGKTEENIMDNVTVEPRERNFFWGQWTNGINGSSGGYELTEYIIPDNVVDMKSYYKTGLEIGLYSE